MVTTSVYSKLSLAPAASFASDPNFTSVGGTAIIS